MSILANGTTRLYLITFALAVLPACLGDAPLEPPSSVLFIGDDLTQAAPTRAAVDVEEPTEASENERRNILLIVSDDHSPDLGAYGNTVIKTPHLDALASEGVLFTKAFATTASCSASRSVILTGLHNHRTGQYGHNHDFHRFESWKHLKSLPELLREAGYRTAISGKHHLGPRETYEFETRLKAPYRSTVLMAEGAREFLLDEDERPFFLYFATHDPHRGGRRRADGTYAGLDDIDTPDDFGNKDGAPEGVTAMHYSPDEVIVPGFLPDTPMARRELSEYYRAVSRMDQGFGRLLSILRESGKYDDTLIIYMSDHGIAFPGAKTTTYDAGLHSPLIVRHPDTANRGISNNALVSWVDITPTILDFANVAEPAYKLQIGLTPVRDQMEREHGLHGRSFLPVLNVAKPEGWDEIYASHTFHEIQMYYPMRVVRGRQYKLIWNIAHGLPYPFAADLWESPTWQRIYRQGNEAMYGPRTVEDYINRPEFELFDIEADPHEAKNLANDPKFAKVLDAYKAKLRSFQTATQDPWLLKWTYE
jgi:N-sulfoglucosamine sulfohydrolase